MSNVFAAPRSRTRSRRRPCAALPPAGEHGRTGSGHRPLGCNAGAFEPDGADILAEDVIPRLLGKWRDDGRRRLEDALALEPVPDCLVHGDLGGDNIHWSADGKLIGVLDWDRAQLFDPAVDAATIGWVHGWDNLREAVDSATYRRAQVWDRTFGVTHLVAALDGRPLAHVDSYVRHIVAWLEQSADQRLP
ncbi:MULTISPECIES: phosphotransferase family protein [Streptosporangium]|uniref:Aminoglycoside phosphotransferase domain-containing protein n=1 Tax=Streptosporangium brasiliense TaxID=47480 RepID=A0ABT9RCH4_9ACTN|nr:phosphotransferase [Streptosporangium brasiliense]MDP9866958.1 hypothetical protein [Streptosporangium brasiliense]